MKKQYQFFGIIALFTLISCGSNMKSNAQTKVSISKQETGAQKDGYKGKVKQVKESNYEAIVKSGEINTGTQIELNGFQALISCCKYTESGNKVEDNYYSSENVLAFKISYKYDDKSNIIERNHYYQGNSVSKNTFKFDDNGNLIEENEFKAGQLYCSTTNKYDDYSNVIETNGEAHYCCDVNGDFFEEKYSFKLTFKYDDKQNVIERNYYQDGILAEKQHTYKYDVNGNMLEDNEYEPDGRLSYKHIYKYDDNGNIIEHNSVSWKYNYDQQGNWTKRIYFENNVPKQITFHEIEYY